MFAWPLVVLRSCGFDISSENFELLVETKNFGSLKYTNKKGEQIESVSQSETFKKQFFAYLKRIYSFDELAYFFKSRGSVDQQGVKEQFKKIYLNDIDIIFPILYPKMVDKLKLNTNNAKLAKEQFKVNVNNFNLELYSFVNIL